MSVNSMRVLNTASLKFLTGNQAFEEGLLGQVLIVLLEVLLGRRHQLDGSELVAMVLSAHLNTGAPGANRPSLLESLDDITDETTL